jgi:hypothetical protein
MKAFQWVDKSNTCRRKPPYLQGYEDGYMQFDMRDGEFYENDKDKIMYGEGYDDGTWGKPNQLEKE